MKLFLFILKRKRRVFDLGLLRTFFGFVFWDILIILYFPSFGFRVIDHWFLLLVIHIIEKFPFFGVHPKDLPHIL